MRFKKRKPFWANGIQGVSLVRTFPNAGKGPLEWDFGPKTHYWAFGIGLPVEIVDKSQGKCKNNAVWKNDRFGTNVGVRGWPYRAKTESAV